MPFVTSASFVFRYQITSELHVELLKLRAAVWREAREEEERRQREREEEEGKEEEEEGEEEEEEPELPASEPVLFTTVLCLSFPSFLGLMPFDTLSCR